MATIKFRDVENGQRFFDPDSGEYCIKTGAGAAVFDSGGDMLVGEPAVFGEDEDVES